MQDFRIAQCQMKVVEDKNENIKHACEMIDKALYKNDDVALITLPEIFNTPYSNDKFAKYAEYENNSPTLNAMCDVASEYGIYLQSGSIPEYDNNKIYNSAYLINPNGKIIAKHRKMHMFDIDTKTMKFTESDTLSPGDNVTTVKTKLGIISLAICYDIRFPELWTLMTKNNSDIILLPAAFNMTTGPLHWEILIRTRAVDTQCYVIATSPAHYDNPYYVAWGHSMIVNPWGEILTQAGFAETIHYADITHRKLHEVRHQIPVLKHRRSDVYDTISKKISWKG